ncbi:MAG: hypothetical protein GC189_01555 [Alphaproteobacteria bacterium]|nr:hypothetical protein [Alphaproteobacteria bacterium]
MRDWPDTWIAVDSDADRRGFEAELAREVAPDHPLHAVPVTLIGRAQDGDDFLFEDADGRCFEVHLTFAAPRQRPPWPSAAAFPSFAAWRKATSNAS